MGIWDSEMSFVGCCGKLPDLFDIKLEPKVYRKIEILMQEKENIEWLAFLMGDIEWDSGYAVITDLHIPDSQSVTMGNVDKVDCDDDVRRSLIGVIHSHHKMGAFFSNDDWNYLNNNHNISIVVSNKQGHNEFKSVVRYRTQCGSYTHINGNVSIHCAIDEAEMNDFIDDIGEKIKSGMGEFKVYTYRPNRHFAHGARGYGYGYHQSATVVDFDDDDLPEPLTPEEMEYFGMC